MTESISPLCAFCKHRHERDFRKRVPSCDAFPDGVPDVIYFECGDHRKPFAGDNGIRFERREELDADEEEYLGMVFRVLNSY